MRSGAQGSCDAEFHSGCLQRIGASAGVVPRPEGSGALLLPPRPPQPRCLEICVAESASLSDLPGFCCLRFLSRWELEQVISPKDRVSPPRRDGLCQLSREKRSAGNTGQ